MTISLSAAPRSARSNEAKRLRSAGQIPAVVYGSIEHPLSVSIDARAFERLFRDAGESTLIELQVDGSTVPALVHEIARNAITNNFEHVDFYAVDMMQEVETEVPITFVGIAPAEKIGAITKVLHALHVRALPNKLPHDITIDLTPLVDLDSAIRVREVVMPSEVTVLNGPDDVIVSVSEQALEEEGVPEAEAVEEPELATKKPAAEE